MTFTEFINRLSLEDKANYEKYSPIRGPITYRLIFNALIKISQNVTYKDVNSFVRYDKALKDVLFVFLAVLEEKIKAQIFKNFDIDPEKDKRNNYNHFDNLESVLMEKNNKDEVTTLYRKFKLNFGEIIEFVKKHPTYFDDIDINQLQLVWKLRNKTMHHLPLLFDYNGSTVEETSNQLQALIFLLPDSYKGKCVERINYPTKESKENINYSFKELILQEFILEGDGKDV